MSERRRRRKNYFVIPSKMFKGGTARFWEGLQENKLLTTKCKECGELFFPPRIICPKCLSKNLEWIELCGEGKLYTWTEILDYRMQFFTKSYILGVVELKEGIGRVITKINAKSEELEINMPLKLNFVKYELKGKDYTMLQAELV